MQSLLALGLAQVLSRCWGRHVETLIEVLGRAVALKFAEKYSVVLLARKPESYNDIVSEIKQRGGNAVGISADVTDQKGLDSAFDKIKQELGSKKLAAAVYNVGGGLVKKPFLDLQPSELEAGLDVGV